MSSGEQLLRDARMIALAAGLLAAPLATAQNTWTGGGDGTNWFNGANWSDGVPVAASTVSIGTGNIILTNATPELASFTMTGGKLTFRGWETALVATEMSIGGELTHLPTLATAVDPVSGQWVPEHRIWLKGSNIAVTATGKLNADFMGYRLNAGPGRATSSYGGARADRRLAQDQPCRVRHDL
ncbi:MAG: hypothetical protein GX590_03540 [Lentisphaerae bacterium]|nr:hypothetical protein [Lentisphaerota bacterium]